MSWQISGIGSLVLPVVNQTVVHVRGELSFHHGRGGRYGHEIRHQRADLVEHGDQLILVHVGNVDLQSLNIQPAVLLDIEQPVVCLIILLLIMIPVGRLIQSRAEDAFPGP